jgi:hypothetical protein
MHATIRGSRGGFIYVYAVHITMLTVAQAIIFKSIFELDVTILITVTNGNTHSFSYWINLLK